jgi:large subunit ribosomal protein L18
VVLKEVSRIKAHRAERIRKRIRLKVRGTGDRPRVYVFKSNRYVYAQVVDDAAGRVLAAASTLEKSFKEKSAKSKNNEACQRLGQILAERLKSKQITRVVFDRGVSPYHGRLKALAEAMRQAGMVF